MEGLEYIAPLKQSNKIIGEYDMLDNICMTLKGSRRHGAVQEGEDQGV